MILLIFGAGLGCFACFGFFCRLGCCCFCFGSRYLGFALGLGAGKWRVVRTVVLPGCVDGVITGCILSVGRILGESAALLFTAGFAHVLNGFFTGLGSSGASLTVAMYVYAKDRGEFEAAFAIAAILLVLTLLVNLCAALAGWYFKKRRA